MTDFDKQMEMVLYHSDEGDVSVDAYIADESIWVSQKGMSEIFGVYKSGISRHLKKYLKQVNQMKKWLLQKLQQPRGMEQQKESGRWIIVDENKKKDY